MILYKKETEKIELVARPEPEPGRPHRPRPCIGSLHCPYRSLSHRGSDAPSRLLQRTPQSLDIIQGVLYKGGATHEAQIHGPLKGAVPAQKALQGSETRN